MALSSSNPFAREPEDDTRPESTAKPAEAAEPTETPAEPSWPATDEDGNLYSPFPPILAKDIPIGGGPIPTDWKGRTDPPVRFDLLVLHEVDPGVVAAAMNISGRDPEALEFWGDISGLYESGAERFTGLGRDHLGDVSFPPTMPEWQAFLADYRVASDRAAAVLRTGGRDPRLMRAWAEATAKAVRSRKMCSAILAQARKYTDPDTGYGWDHLVAAKSGASLVDRAVAADKAWKDQRAGMGRGYTPPILDPALMGTSSSEPVIGDLCATGRSLMVISPDTSESTEAAEALVTARIDGGEFYGHEVASGPVVYVDGVTSDTVLADRWGDEVGGDLVVLAHQSIPLDIREPEVRRALAESLPAGALLVVNDTSLMALSDISEMTAEAGAWMTGWTWLAKDVEAAGLVIFHGSTKNNPSRGRGHASVSSWGNTRVALVDGVLQAPGQRTGSKRSSSDARPRALTEVVKDDPGQSQGHYARVLGISATTVATLVEALSRSGDISVHTGPRNAKILFPAEV